MKGAHLSLLQTFLMAGAYSISTKRRLDALIWTVVDNDVHAIAVRNLTSDGCSQFCGLGSE